MPRVAVNGVRLNVERRGSGPALLLLHGFTGSGASWDRHLPTFSRGYSTVAVDLIGHGASDAPVDPGRYRMERCVADLVALLDHLGIDRAAVLGYSMGGRVALHLALAAPERVSALVLESASPGIADPAARQARVRSDEALAEMIEREGLEAFVDYWERVPLFATQERLPADVRDRVRRRRLASSPRGLANSLRGMGAGAIEPVVDRLGQIRAPTLIIVGELDRKYRDLGRMMESTVPNVRLEVVPNAGHTVHLEQPEAFERAVLAYLAGLETSRSDDLRFKDASG